MSACSTHDLLTEQFELEKKYHDLILAENNPVIRHHLYHEAYTAVNRIHRQRARINRGVGPREIRWFLPFMKGREVLEIGCGNGTFALEIAQAAKHVVAIDVSDSVELAKERAKNKELQNIEFRQLNCLDLDYPEHSFDIVYNNDLVEHLHPDDFIHLLRTVYPIIRPNGFFVILTPSRLTGPHDVSKIWIEKGQEAQGLHLHEYTYTELNQILRTCGFRQVKSPLLSLGIARRLRLLSISHKVLVSAKYKSWLESLRIFTKSEVIMNGIGLYQIFVIAQK
jgi:2-polyprenyl-3-methyl-5-hydroxy-6-metoxy-1,4-benzoquinol methylase